MFDELNIERLLPHAFVGEKVAKPDEGVFTYRDNVAEWRSSFWSITSHQPIARHASSAFGTFSPRKARGEKALDAKESLKKCEKY